MLLFLKKNKLTNYSHSSTFRKQTSKWAKYDVECAGQNHYTKMVSESRFVKRKLNPFRLTGSLELFFVLFYIKSILL